MILYLVRHGETEWNALGRIQGRTDIPLNERGRRQADQLAKEFIKNPRGVTAVYASPLLRAQATGRVIAASLGIPFEIAEGLEELDFGAFEGKTFERAQENWPELYGAIFSGAFDVCAPGGETFRELTKRMLAVLSSIAGKAKGNVIVVSHGAAIRCIRDYASGSGKQELLGNGSITQLTDTEIVSALKRLSRERQLIG